MGQVSASSTVLINAAPDAVLAAVADYQTVRPKILSSHYSDYQVLEGGQGAGTVATWKLQATKSRVRDVKADRRRRRPHGHREGRQLDDGDQLDRRTRRTRLVRHGQDVVDRVRAASGVSSRRPSHRWGCARSRPRCWTTSRSKSKALAGPSGAAEAVPRKPAIPRTTASAYFCRPSGSSSAPSRQGSSCCPARPGSTGTAPGSARRCRSAGSGRPGRCSWTARMPEACELVAHDLRELHRRPGLRVVERRRRVEDVEAAARSAGRRRRECDTIALGRRALAIAARSSTQGPSAGVVAAGHRGPHAERGQRLRGCAAWCPR